MVCVRGWFGSNGFPLVCYILGEFAGEFVVSLCVILMFWVWVLWVDD